MQEGDGKSFWRTVPGVLTAIAGLVTALSGLIAALAAAGVLEIGRPEHAEVAELATSTEEQQHSTESSRASETGITVRVESNRESGRDNTAATDAGTSAGAGTNGVSGITGESATDTGAGPDNVPGNDPIPEVDSDPETSAAPSISPEDCLPYDWSSLHLVNEGASGWLLTDGRARMLMLDNELDGKNALALAKRHTKQCFIGRDNDRSNRKSYIVEYWEGDTGQATTISAKDCLAYDLANLRAVDEGASGWLLTDGVSRMLTLDNETDAKNALALARRHTAHCFIGRDNSRPDRGSYIVEYWT
jgi:hypothetical protein